MDARLFIYLGNVSKREFGEVWGVLGVGLGLGRSVVFRELHLF